MIPLTLLHKRFLPSPFKYLTPYSYFHANYKFNDFSRFYCVEAIRIQSDNGHIYFFDRLLQQCISRTEEWFNLGRPVNQIHAQIILTSSLFSAFLSARLISAYSKLFLLNDARKVFDTCPKHCYFSSLFWNSMLRAYLSGFRYGAAIELYLRMRKLNVQPDKFGSPLIVRACAMRGDVRLCELVHSHAIKMGLASNLYVNNELVGMYGEIGYMDVALKVFDQMPLRSCVSWNVVISGFTKNLDCNSAFAMLCRMENEGWEPNSVTWTSVISSFARCGLVDKTWQFYVWMRDKGVDATAESIAVVISVCDGVPIRGEIVHGHVIRGGFGRYNFVSNALISMYGRNGAVEKAECLFSGLNPKSLVSWNALISAYAQSGLCDEALSAFLRLENENSIARPNVVSWTAVINGFAASEHHKETTLELFRRMQFAKVPANAVTAVAVLSACAELSALPLGREIHGHIIRASMGSNMLVINSLINMYMKCGSLRSGQTLFEEMVSKGIISWNTMITGYGMHGLGHEALKIFNQMVLAGVNPDEVTLVAVLSACSHSGLVSEGREIFDRMNREFQMKPQVEHYSCMVDLFGRAGLLEEARGVLESMPMEPNAPVWGALLNSCEMHKNVEEAKESAGRLFDLNTGTTGSYMLLSNLYAADGRWDESAKVRLLARSKGLKKVPGQSWIEVKKKVHSFSAGRELNLNMEELFWILEDLKLHMVMENYVSLGLLEASSS